MESADQDDVALSASSISNGAFSGTASGGGGGSPNGNYVASDGTYEGMFTGADASEVIGSINIPMTRSIDHCRLRDGDLYRRGRSHPLGRSNNL